MPTAFQPCTPLKLQSPPTRSLTPLHRRVPIRKPSSTRIPQCLSHPPPAALPPRLLEVAHEAADAAASILVANYLQPLSIDYKSDQSPVTKADREAEAAIRRIIHANFPDHDVLAEETGGSSDAEYVWVIDPLDGTKAFVCGRPTFATLIALVHNGYPVVGIINQPITKQRWVGILGAGTTLNGNPVHVNSVYTPLNNCILQATTPDMFIGLDSILFRKVSKNAKCVVWGGDCYAYAMLSTGMSNLVVEADLKPWDFLALVPVVLGAGGYMCDWMGCPISIQTDGRVVAGNSQQLVADVVEIMGLIEEFGLNPDQEVLGKDRVREVEKPEDRGVGFAESMTGMGVGVMETDEVVVSTRIRAVNSRYCEVNMKVPSMINAYENELIGMVKRKAMRGRIIVNINIQSAGETDPIPLSVDKNAARKAGILLRETAEAAGLDGNEVGIRDVIQFSEVFVRRENGGREGQVIPVVRQSLELALDDLGSARRKEGWVIEEDLVRRTRRIIQLVDEISSRAPDRVVEEQERLKRLTQGLGEGRLGEGRLETELVLFADRVDISEELLRLRAHVNMFEMTFMGGDMIGKRLGFLLQEMKREATTMSNKCYDAPMSHLTVLIREEMEKIGEQTNNIR